MIWIPPIAHKRGDVFFGDLTQGLRPWCSAISLTRQYPCHLMSVVASRLQTQKDFGRAAARPCYEDCQVSFGFICFFSLSDVFVFVFRLRFLSLRIRMIPDQPAIRTCPHGVSA